VKILEALAAGKAVVASPLAVEGLEVEHGRQLLLAESDEEFATAVTELLDHPEKRAAIARTARQWACENLDWQASVAAYESLYETLLTEQPAPGATLAVHH
jgi:glycosyltransferase involved in cell wall biosynthesis